MKLRYLLFVLLLALSGCQEDEKIPLVGQRLFELDSDGHLLRIAIRRGLDWQVSGDTLWWCKMEQLRGQRQDSLLIHIDVNLVNTPREASLKVTDGNETEEIHIRQAAATKEYLYKLPVVFHIFSDSSEPTDDELEDRLLYLLQKPMLFLPEETDVK